MKKKKETQFRFFKNTPLIDFQNTIHFSNNSERDRFFLTGNKYEELDEVIELDFNFIRDRSEVILPVSYNDMRGVNYCTFKSEFEDTRYYAYVINYEYRNDEAVKVYLLIDGIMTYTQGNVLENIPNLDIQRQHLTKQNYEKNLWELKNNDDILKTSTKSYFHTERILFNDLVVLISSSVDLQSKFGTVNNPKMTSSYGKMFDEVTSPLNLYVCEIDDFNKLMTQLRDYPWIAQNFTSLQLIPRMFMTDNLQKITFASTETLSGVDYLYSVSGSYTYKNDLIQSLTEKSYSMNELYRLFGLDPVHDRHLLRNEYTTTELYNYSGGQLFIDNGQLNEATGLFYNADIITGYHTEMKVFVDQYRVQRSTGLSKAGAYVNDSLVFDSFDDIPMMIDNFKLSLSKNANQRQLAESKLVSNRIGNVMDKDANLKDRFFNAMSLASNLSPSNLFGKFNDEHEYYRNQKAQQADMALETPSISQQTNGNSFNIANHMFGIHFKYSKPSKEELDKLRKYYKLFGYQVEDKSSTLDSVESMSLCNYVQFSGSWTIPEADVSIIEMMKAQFENGVRLWRNNGQPNPMAQDVLQNKVVI